MSTASDDEIRRALWRIFDLSRWGGAQLTSDRIVDALMIVATREIPDRWANDPQPEPAPPTSVPTTQVSADTPDLLGMTYGDGVAFVNDVIAGNRPKDELLNAIRSAMMRGARP